MPFSNPILHQDYPDVDVIRVNDTYYMISTTMHFMPGGVILRSYDLQNWEFSSYVYDVLDRTDNQRMITDKTIYGKGMWAATLRYHKGTFYVLFVANDTHKTYLYRASAIEGPWHKSEVDGFYHDASLFFDEDEHTYIIYGNTDIWLTELNESLTGPKDNGLHRLLVSDKGNPNLGYEGSHFYKIDGYYYLFLIHSLAERCFRTEACFSSNSLLGTFEGGDVFADDIHFRDAGVAQGGIVDTPDGDWYAILFQDHGAVGRIPVVIPASLHQGNVTIGNAGSMPLSFEVKSTRPDYTYEPLYTSGFLNTDKKLHSAWQWNHEPWNEAWCIDDVTDSLTLHSAKLCTDITHSINTLTQRTLEPYSAATVTLDISNMKNGDVAGLSAFQGCYGYVAVTKQQGQLSLIMCGKDPRVNPPFAWENKSIEQEYARIPLSDNVSNITLRCATTYTDDSDKAEFFYAIAQSPLSKIGPTHPLAFLLDHFCGCRFGLFYYSTTQLGGSVTFSNFCYDIVPS